MNAFIRLKNGGLSGGEVVLNIAHIVTIEPVADGTGVRVETVDGRNFTDVTASFDSVLTTLADAQTRASARKFKVH